jgi:hypothetical protein
MAERFKAPVLKTGVAQVTVGSNPTPSATSSVSRQFAWLTAPTGRTKALTAVAALGSELGLRRELSTMPPPS